MAGRSLIHEREFDSRPGPIIRDSLGALVKHFDETLGENTQNNPFLV